MEKSSRRSVGFTLVELLVVIGIIAVLVALLMPALSKARKHALEVKCAANLRSIGQAMAMYTQQFGYYPGYMGSTLGVNGMGFAVWPVRLRPFLGGAQEVFNCPSQDERCRWDKGHPPASPADAATPAHASYGYEVGERILWIETTRFSYGYNYAGVGARVGEQKGLGIHTDNWQWLDQWVDRELKASRVRVPSQMIAVADSNGDGKYDLGIYPLDAPTIFPGTVHRGGANVLFCDGHVQWNELDELALTWPNDSDTTYTRWGQVARRWNNDNRWGPF